MARKPNYGFEKRQMSLPGKLKKKKRTSGNKRKTVRRLPRRPPSKIDSTTFYEILN